MIDFKVDETLDLQFSEDTNDLLTTTEYSLQNQRFRVAVMAVFDDLIGTIDRDKLVQQVELRAFRISRALDFVEEVSDISVTQDAEEPNKYNVELVYVTGDEFVFDLE